MSDLVVIVPSRGRPHTVAEMAEAFERTWTADTRLTFALDADDPAYNAYVDEVLKFDSVRKNTGASKSMVEALNRAATDYLYPDVAENPVAIAFIGDDHRPRTKGWDRAYLDALAARPGIVYGNDLFQGERLPTQCAMSTQVVRALGHMAPPALTHLYVDNYWRDLGKAADCLTYLPDVIVEHVHPVAGKAQMDEGYRRVNAPAMYGRDSAAYQAYMIEHAARDIAAVRDAVAGVTA
jgi:hypothetical protein